jgi:hypothetical protein
LDASETQKIGYNANIRAGKPLSSKAGLLVCRLVTIFMQEVGELKPIPHSTGVDIYLTFPDFGLYLQLMPLTRQQIKGIQQNFGLSVVGPFGGMRCTFIP